MRARWVWVYVVAGLVASALHWRIQDEVLSTIVWDAIGLAAVAAAWTGIRVNRPELPGPWRFIAIGLTLLVSGDLTWDVLVFVFDHSRDSVPASDIFYLGAYVFLVLGLVRLGAARAASRDALVDGTVVALVIAAPLWLLVVRPTIHAASGSTFDQIATIAYPLLDCILLVAVAYTAFTLTRWNASAALLVAGLVATTAGDIVYARLGTLGILEESLWLDPIWPASYTLLAAAMVHPAMRRLGEPSGAGRELLDRTRVLLLAASLLAVPVMLALQLGMDNRESVAIMGAFSIVIAGLVGWRMVSLVRETHRVHDETTAREAQFRAFVQHATDVIAVSDPRGRYTYVSPAIEHLLGREPDEFLGKTVFDYIHPDDRDIVRRMAQEVSERPGRSVVVEARARHADDTWRWMEATATNRVDEPDIRGYVSNLRDISERKRTEALDGAATRALEAVARGAPLRVTLTDLLATADGHLGGSRCALRLTATDGTDHDTVAVRADDEGTARWCVPVLAADSPRLGIITVHSRDEVGPDDADVSLVERVAALVAVAVDRAAAEDRLEHQAFHDPLTGLPNRALLIDRLGQALLRLSRNVGDVAVLFLDVDRFKVINDSLGHEAGDELLVELGRRIEGALQAADTVARFGGDEFVIVCERLRGEADARVVAERLARAISEPVTLSHGGGVVITASIGIALARGPHDRPETLLRDADTAMYRAKERGRARTEVFDALLRSHVVVRLETERALRHALDRGEMRVLYQPAIRLADDSLAGAEALLRWRHPVRGLVGPLDFVPVAEETGLIGPIGEWVIEQACSELSRQKVVRPMDPIVLSVNLSGRQLGRTDLVEKIAATLCTAGVEPHLLCLEITESVLLDDVEASVAALHSLKDLGVLLALDDFGTGYSSLGYLKQFPFDVLKIDRAFVAGLGTSDADDAIVLAATQMAHALGMWVAAEGVETERQRDRARELGCDLAQGFLFEAPGLAQDVLGSAPLQAVSG